MGWSGKQDALRRFATVEHRTAENAENNSEDYEVRPTASRSKTVYHSAQGRYFSAQSCDLWD